MVLHKGDGGWWPKAQQDFKRSALPSPAVGSTWLLGSKPKPTRQQTGCIRKDGEYRGIPKMESDGSHAKNGNLGRD